MTTNLSADDPRLARLRPEHATELRTMIGESEFPARQARVDALLPALGLSRVEGPVVKRAMLDPRNLDDETRLVLELLSELEVGLSRYPVYSQRSWLRRWLGLEPAGLLFEEIDDAGTTRSLLEAMRAREPRDLLAFLAPRPIAERVELLVELLDSGQDYSSGSVPPLLAATIRELDASAGAWAVRAADAAPLAPMVKLRVADRERAIFLALARAKVPIEPRWDPLVPLSFGSFWHWAMQECLAAIPAERRASAVIARLERANWRMDPVLHIATEALALVPDPSVARWMLERWEESGRPNYVMVAMRAVGKKHPAVLEVISAPEKPLALVPRAVAVPKPLDEVSRAQLDVLSRGLEEDEPLPTHELRRFVLERDGQVAYDVWLIVDSGTVFAAGTTDVVAEIILGGVETKDASLRRDLKLALVAARDLGKATKRAAKKAAPKTAQRLGRHVRVREATAADHALYLRLLPELEVDDPPPDAAKWANELQPATLVAERDGEAVGVCTFVMLEGAGHVRTLVTDPRARRTGAGRALMLNVSRRLRAAGCTKWTLNVKPQNVAAVALYESLGFVKDYSAKAMRFPWPALERLPASPAVSARLVTPEDDRAIEVLFSLSRGHVDGLRKAKRILLTLTDGGGEVLALAGYDPKFPGAFPFRVKEPLLARALLEAMKPHALPGAEFTGVVVEDDDALAKLLEAHGASVRMDIDHYTGILNPSPSPSGRGSG